MAEQDVESGPSGVERTVAFSDAVFAIAITLLVLPLTEAELTRDHLVEDLLALGPRALTFALSFAVIGRYWLLHHREFRRMVRLDNRLLVVNLLFLFWVAFLPFPTSLLGEFGDTAPATVLYAANLIATAATSTLLWWYAVRRGLVEPVDARQRRTQLVDGVAVVIALLPSIPLAFVDPGWAKVSWLLLVPAGVLSARIGARQGSQPTLPASRP